MNSEVRITHDSGVNFFPSMLHMDVNKGNKDSLKLNERDVWVFCMKSRKLIKKF